MAEGSICRNCFHSYVCEKFNENKDDDNKKCHFFNDHFVHTTDVVEVVRCKDCKHYCGNWLPGLSKYDNYGHCKRIEFLSQEHTTRFEDDFCSYGTPKETIKTSRWLTEGMTEEQIQKAKAEAIMQAEKELAHVKKERGGEK